MNTTFLLSPDINNRNELLKKKIIHYYIAHGDATLADLGIEMDMSIPTVTKLVSELQEDGYILEFGKQNTNGGRKPNIYGLNPASGFFVGVDILKDKLNLAAIDFKGDTVEIKENIPYLMENTPAALEQLCLIIRRFIDSLPFDQSKLLATGINISGRVKPASGHSYSLFYFEEKPLVQILQERLQTKVFIENDSRAMTYGEYMKGVVKGENNVLFINMTWGLGLGIVIDGNLYYGKSGFSGEFGHFCMVNNEVLCQCGKKGCLETAASGSAFHRILKERHKEGSNTILADKLDKGEDVSLHEIIEAVNKEDVLCIEILEEIGLNLGKGIAGLINIFNPELVVLGGILSRTGEYISLPIKAAIRKYSLNLVNQDTEVKLSKLGEQAGVLGACLLSRSKLLGMIVN